MALSCSEVGWSSSSWVREGGREKEMEEEEEQEEGGREVEEGVEERAERGGASLLDREGERVDAREATVDEAAFGVALLCPRLMGRDARFGGAFDAALFMRGEAAFISMAMVCVGSVVQSGGERRRSY